MKKKDKIYIAGHRGMVGSAIMRRLTKRRLYQSGYQRIGRIRSNQPGRYRRILQKRKTRICFPGRGQGWWYLANNTYRAQFIYENIQIQNNVIHFSYKYGVKKLLFLGSSCIYPKLAPQPLKEEYLLTGLLEPTNEPYAIAKIAGIKMCQAYNDQYGTDYISVMPTNLYGPNDNFDLKTSHVLPALIRKFHEAKVTMSNQVEIWGSGSPRREFLHVDDLADACFF